MIKRFIGKFLTTVLFFGAFTTVAFADVMHAHLFNMDYLKVWYS